MSSAPSICWLRPGESRRLERDDDVDEPPHDARLSMAAAGTGSMRPPAAKVAPADSLERRPAAAAAAAAAALAWLGRRKPAAAVWALSSSVLGRRVSWLG